MKCAIVLHGIIFVGLILSEYGSHFCYHGVFFVRCLFISDMRSNKRLYLYTVNNLTVKTKTTKTETLQ